jgi:hypothetical protein
LSNHECPPRFACILSTGRTGTKAIAHHLDGRGQGVVAHHEPAFSWVLGVASNMYRCERIERRQLAWLLARTRRKRVEAGATRLYVESNPFLCGFIDVLDEVLGEVCVVHIVRHPGTYVTSALDWGSLSGLKRVASNSFPYWVCKPELLDAQPVRSWGEMSDPERLAWRWANTNRYLNRGEALFGDRYLRIRYEELFDPGQRGLDRIVDWLGLTAAPDPPEERTLPLMNASHRGEHLRHWNWPPELRERVIDSCADLLELYGYEL